MSKIIKFKLDLIRVQFKIKGTFNILSLSLVLVVSFLGIKFFQRYIGHYEQLSVLIGLSIYVFFCKYIFVTDFDLKCKQMKTYFSAFNEIDIKKYYLYKNLIIFLGINIYLLFPTKIEDITLFLLYMFILNVLVMTLIIAKNKLTDSRYYSFNLLCRILVCVALILYLRNYELLNIHLGLNHYNLIVGLALNIFIVVEEFKLIKISKQNKNMITGFAWSKKIPSFCKNSDVLFVIRKNMLIEPILFIVCGNIAFDKISEDIFTKLFTLIISYLCAYVTVYRALMKNEENNVFFFFRKISLRKIKINKLLSTVCLSILLFVITLPLVLFWVSLRWIMCGYIISLLIFMMSGYIVKIQGEKVFNYRVIILDKDIALLIIIQIISTLIISCAVVPNIIIYIERVL